jgi:general stress protein YciG
MGTREGGIVTAEKNRTKDPAFYSRIGAKGGRTRTAATARKGFGSSKARASMAGKVGGKLSRRPVLV